MYLLIVSSTPFEFYELKSFYETHESEFFNKGIQLDFLVCGVGLVPTVYRLMSHLHDAPGTYDGVIQMGIAGSFREKYKPGEVVQVVSEVFGDAGAEDSDGQILDLFDLNLWESNEEPFDRKVIFESETFPVPLPAHMVQVHGLTVGLGSGREETIRLRKKKFAADTESMEGAALFYVCHQEGVPFRQIRSISNPITPRDTDQWQIKKAISSLNGFMISWLLG